MNENTKKLLELVKENPDLPIVPMVESEVVCDDGYCRWLGSVGSVGVGEYALFGERFYEERDDLKDAYYCNNTEIFENMSEEEVKLKLEELTKDMWTKAIIINIDTPDI